MLMIVHLEWPRRISLYDGRRPIGRNLQSTAAVQDCLQDDPAAPVLVAMADEALHPNVSLVLDVPGASIPRTEWPDGQ
ncbi:hypothetical protein [Sulfobacillus harzensis]|uniref:Uncharacterized protein n=1 Tax=Sulfobacillus harzensis TaxID=2729629 RepID=A0A7Y0L7N1_9FIRM|nr:hypothetical protein [Sulfobacillus harzensis]NMP24508.1 hypothetical protein [Sulfobacillus harzensis]